MASLMQWRLPRLFMQSGVRFLVPRQRLGVGLIGMDETGRVLLLRHVFHPHIPWGVPGGWLERNEAPADGVLRELQEETGLTAVLGPVIHVTHERHPTHIGIAYFGRIQPGTITLSPEIIEARWFDRTELPRLTAFTYHAIQTGFEML